MQSNIDLSPEMLITPYRGGVKLMRPAQDHTSLVSLQDAMKLSFNIFFHNCEFITEELNEATWTTCAYESKADAIGSNINRTCIRKDQSERVENNNLMVIDSHKMLIIDEPADLINDQKINAVSIKFPWYNNEDQVVGVFGCAMLIKEDNLSNIAASFSMVSDKFMQRSQTMNHLLPGKEINGSYFTSRELDVIQWILRGKAMREIAIILNLSPRTIEHYIVNIKTKAKVKTKSQLIEYFLKS